MTKQSSLFYDNCDDFVRGLKERIRSAQVKAALAVNQELVRSTGKLGKKFFSGSKQKPGEQKLFAPVQGCNLELVANRGGV
jgi:hypothetical protein